MICLTSKDDEVDEVLGLRMGADDYIKKPFSQRLLIERIDYDGEAGTISITFLPGGIKAFGDHDFTGDAA